ncbi:hypothetical protein Dimus_021919 [Dionaea muscipula]
MVIKIIKKTPTKPTSSISHLHRRCRSQRSTPTPPLKRKTAISASSTAVIATLHDSLFTCRRRLAKLFSKLTRITTTTKKSPKRRHGFQKLLKKTNNEQSLRFAIAQKTLVFGLLPPLEDPKITIILDLDETLVHSKPDPPPGEYDFIVRPEIDGQIITFYVLKRPGVDEFLEFLARRSSSFEVVVFTAGLRAYASLVLDELDREPRAISHRLYRDSCRTVEGRYVKDLSEMGRDLRRMVIVDDNPCSYALQPENGIPVRPFVDDVRDGELWRLMEVFEGFDRVEDLREAINGDE